MSETTTTSWGGGKVNSNNGSGPSNSNKRPRPASAAAAASAPRAAAAFIASKTWQGSRDGYYFGTESKGTGYYLDSSQQQDHEEEPRNKQQQRRRVVRIAEEKNEVRTLPPPNKSSAELLLQEAEEAAAAREKQAAAGAASGSGSSKPITLTDLSSVRGVLQAAKGLNKAMERNQLERAEHYPHGDPTQYMDSEVSLYEYLKALQAVAADPMTLYPAILNTNIVADQLAPLLQHDNPDVRTAVISLLVEWLDVSLLVDNDETTGSAIVQPVVALAASVLAECSELLVANLGFLQRNNTSSSSDDSDDDDSDEDDEVGQGAADILTLLENLLEMDLTLTTIMAGSNSSSDNESLRLVPDGSSVAMTLCREQDSNKSQATTHHLVAWLLSQVESSESTSSSSSLSLGDRSLELLALLAPREDVHQVLTDWSRIPVYASMFDEDDNDDKDNDNAVNKKPAAKGKAKKEPTTIDGIEILLQRVAPFRKQQTLDDAEMEVLENSTMILAAALVFNAQNVQAFLDAQGIELVLRCLKARTHAGGVTLRWLDFIGSSSSSSEAQAVYKRACEHLIDAGALKYLFPLLMGRSLPKPSITAATANKPAKLKKTKAEWQHNIEQTTIRILYALTRHLTDASPHDAKQRLLAKFCEQDAQKCKRLVDLCLSYDQKARSAEYKFYRSDVEEALEGQGMDESVQLAAALDAKLKGGGDLFHRLGAMIAFCCSHSRSCHEHVLAHLKEKESGIGLVRDAVQEFTSILADDEQKAQLESYLEQL